MTELTNSIKGFNTRLDNAEERFSKLKDRSFEIIQLHEQEEKWMKKNEESLQELWGIIKRTNICIVGVWRKKRREKGRNLI